MRASIQTSMRAEGAATASTAARFETPTVRRSAPKARPCTTPMAIHAGKCARAAAVRDSIQRGEWHCSFGENFLHHWQDQIGMSTSGLDTAFDHDTVFRNATEQRSVAVSIARTFTTHPSYCRRCCRRRHHRRRTQSDLRQSRVKESSHVFNVSGHRHRRQARQENTSVGFGAHALVAQHDDTKIVRVTNEPAHALLESDDGLRYLLFEKRIAASSFDGSKARFQYWIVRHGKRQLVDTTTDNAAPLTSTPSRNCSCPATPHCHIRGIA